MSVKSQKLQMVNVSGTNETTIEFSILNTDTLVGVSVTYNTASGSTYTQHFVNEFEYTFSITKSAKTVTIKMEPVSSWPDTTMNVMITYVGTGQPASDIDQTE